MVGFEVNPGLGKLGKQPWVGPLLGFNDPFVFPPSHRIHPTGSSRKKTQQNRPKLHIFGGFFWGILVGFKVNTGLGKPGKQAVGWACPLLSQ